MKYVYEKLKNSKVMFALTLVATMFLVSANVVLAKGSRPEDPTIIKGAVELLKYTFTWLNLLIPVTAGVKFTIHAWQKSMAEGEGGEVTAQNKAMKRTIIWGAVALGGNAIITLMFWYLAP